MARIALAVAVLVMSVAPIHASAHHHDPRDANDTRGLLDIRHVDTFGRPRPGFRPVFHVRTFSRWARKDIEDRGFFIVALDTSGNKRPDYYALVRSAFRRRGAPRLRASLWRDRRASKSDRRVATLHAKRANRRALSVRIPFSEMRRHKRRHYRWFVKTLFTSRKCKKVCMDRVPNHGAFVEPNGR